MCQTLKCNDPAGRQVLRLLSRHFSVGIAKPHASRQENSREIKDLQQPFYMQLQLLRDKGSHLESIFKHKTEKVTDNAALSADIRKTRKQGAASKSSIGSRPEQPVRQQNSPTEFQSRKEKC
ncbi:hypothetical protein AVEN_189223-1, partial [Araneus ventricosus]